MAKKVTGDISVYVAHHGDGPDLNYGPGHTHYNFGPVGTFLPNSPDTMNWIATRNGAQQILTQSMREEVLEGKMVIWSLRYTGGSNIAIYLGIDTG